LEIRDMILGDIRSDFVLGEDSGLMCCILRK